MRVSERLVLAFKPGLGKSYPAIEAAMDHEGPHIIACPTYLMNNWYDYLLEYDIEASVIKGSLVQKILLLERLPTWCIISHESLRNFLRANNAPQRYPHVARNPIGTLIVDEAHRLRGRQSQLQQSITKMAKRAEFVYMLTGSPMYKDESDVFTMLRICDPEQYSSFWRWANEHLVLIDTPFTTIVRGVKDREAFAEMLSQYVLTKDYHEVNLGVPNPAIPVYLSSDLTPESRREYREIKRAQLEFNPHPDNPRDQAQAMVGLKNLRQLVASDANKLMLARAVREDLRGKLVFFCWYRDTAYALQEALGLENAVYTGSLSVTQRAQALGQFEFTENGTLIATVASLGEGVNLQFCHQVAYYEEDWIYERRNQARARFHRVGQTSPVVEYFLHARGTTDSIIHNRASKIGARVEDIIRDLRRGE